MLSGDRLMVDFKRMGVSVSVCEVSAGSSSFVGQVLSGNRHQETSRSFEHMVYAACGGWACK